MLLLGFVKLKNGLLRIVSYKYHLDLQNFENKEKILEQIYFCVTNCQFDSPCINQNSWNLVTYYPIALHILSWSVACQIIRGELLANQNINYSFRPWITDLNTRLYSSVQLFLIVITIYYLRLLNFYSCVLRFLYVMLHVTSFLTCILHYEMSIRL